MQEHAGLFNIFSKLPGATAMIFFIGRTLRDSINSRVSSLPNTHRWRDDSDIWWMLSNFTERRPTVQLV